MFIPKQFAISDSDEIYQFIQRNAFGILTTQHQGRPYATHLPFLLNTEKTHLHCHLAKLNPQWQSLEEQEALIVLAGPHDYVSPSWYNSPGVPTWNYQAVHIYGQCRLMNSTEQLEEMVAALSHEYEQNFEKPWQPNYNPRMLNAIVGVEIEITDIQCKYKLSQNKPIEDREQVINELEARGSHQLATAMKSQRP